MGRRKIEIRPIKDDRNRSVTFLKRKGGLFKKAHELSVLCSVDVAVIIFGNNKKLYEFSSGDMHEILQRYQYYGGPHEHKGPADFLGKRGGDDDDDDDDGEVSLPPGTAGLGGMPYTSQPGYPSMHPPVTASPPMANGLPLYDGRQRTPQPPMIARPDSRNRAGSVPPPGSMPHASLPPSMANGYAYVGPGAPPGIYNAPQGSPPAAQTRHLHQPPTTSGPSTYAYPPSTAPSSAQLHGTHLPPQPTHSMSHPLPSGYPSEQQSRAPLPPHLHHYPPPADRAQSMPPGPHVAPPPPQLPSLVTDRPSASPPPQIPLAPPLDMERRPHDSLLSSEPKPSAKSHSIFTPIDDSRSLLAQHWGIGASSASTTASPDVKTDPRSDRERASSADIASGQQPHTHTQQSSDTARIPRTERLLSQPSRTSSLASLSGDKRPKLKVHIPSEHSDDDGNEQASNGANAAAPAQSDQAKLTDSRPSDRKGSSAVLSNGRASSLSAGGSRSGSLSGGPRSSFSHDSASRGRAESLSAPGSGIHLPPPSPSASAILSAGATGPANPFARTLPLPQPPSASSNPSSRSPSSGGGLGSGGGSGNGSGSASGSSGAGNPPTSSASTLASINALETPISALPSRFMADGLLPSPSSFYPEWGFSRGSVSSISGSITAGGAGGAEGSSSNGGAVGTTGGGNSGNHILPSPLGLMTPLVASAPAFLREETSRERKRKTPEAEPEVPSLLSEGKRVKV